MSQAAETVAAPPSARLHRRRQQVVVRACTTPDAPPADERRRRMPTLVGLAPREAMDTLPETLEERATLPGDPPVAARMPANDDVEHTPAPCSGVRVRVDRGEPPMDIAPAEPVTSAESPSLAPEHPLPGSPACKRRPELLLDDVDAERARRYLAVARQLIACGIFEPVG